FLLLSAYSAGWWLVIMLGALPAVIAVYAVRVGPRTDADNRADALNREYFLPYGHLYFPPDVQPAGVARVDWTPPEPGQPINETPREAHERKRRAGRFR